MDFSPLMRQPDDPTCFEDYLYQDIPMIGLQVTTFNDATLVSLNFSHIMWDAMGLKDFLDAWSLTLQGRDDEVIPLIENDPLALLGCSHELREFVPRDKVETSATPPYMPEQYKHANNQLDVIQLLRLGLRQVLDKMTHKNLREEFRTICVPATYIDALRKEALQALQIDYSNMPSVIASENDQERRLGPLSTFLSDGDILCAWWTRHIIASRIRNATKSHKTVAVLNMMGLRGILAQAGLLPDSGALVGNAIAPVPALLRAQDLMAGGPLGLGRVARALRLAITQLGTRPQVEALLSLQRRAYGSHDDNHINDKNKKKKRGKGKSGLPALFGDAGMHMVVCTNWTKAAFFDVDFSAAVVDEIGCDGLWEDERIARSGLPSVNVRARPRLEDSVIGCDGLWEEEHVLREKVPLSGATHLAARVVAKPSGIHMHLITAGTPAFLMSIFTILGRDASGSYWIQGMLRKEYWSQIEKALGH